MAKHFYVAFTSPVEGREEEFRDWYVGQHLDDLLGVSHCSSARLFALSDTQRAEPPYPWKYMAVYEIDTDDLQGFLDGLAERRGTDAMRLSDALGPDKWSYFVTPVAEKFAK